MHDRFRGVAAASPLCYGRRMAEVASRTLRNQARSVLERVAAGEDVTITVDGRPVARVVPVEPRLAATAIALGVPVVTQDGDFDDVPGLALIRV